MAAPLVEADTYPATVTVPSDGDNATAASVVTAFQALANRSNKHKLDLDFLSTGARAATDGAKHIRRVTSIGNLQAIVGGAGLNGECAIVDALGLYVYSSADATAADGNWIVAPGSGGGRWRHVSQGLLNTAQGLPRLDATTKIPASQIPSYNLDTLSASVSPNNEVFSDQLDADTLSYEDFPAGSQITIPAGLATDRIFAEAHFHAKLNGQTGIVRFECAGAQYGKLIVADTDNVYRPYHLFSLEIPGSTGSRTLKLQALVSSLSGSPHLIISVPIIVRARIVRP